MTRQTALYARHKALGAKCTEFAGYELPLFYPQGQLFEHRAVRETAGLFDVSHMAQCRITGKQAPAFLDFLLTNRLSTLKPGRMRYTLMLNEAGGVKDDLLIYAFSETHYMAVLNAANREKDMAWIQACADRFRSGFSAVPGVADDLELSDLSDGLSLLALQGPQAEAKLLELTGADVRSVPARYYSFNEAFTWSGFRYLLSRNGYTGEDGFEICAAAEAILPLFDRLVEGGVAPCGLGARDTLRLEAGMPLYGHELREDLRADQCGLDAFIKMDKEGFIGKAALEVELSAPLRRLGLLLEGRGIAREGYPVLLNGRVIGTVSSGTQLPTIGRAGAMAYVTASADLASGGLSVEIRGRQVPASCAELPFYKRAR